VRHYKDRLFQPLLDALPPKIQALAQKNFKLLRRDPKQPSLQFKRIRDDLWSVRIGRNYRALALEVDDGFRWFWIGPHDKYGKLIA